jgi:hypothetical protein
MTEYVPEWTQWLEMAADWGVSPWEIETAAPGLWVDRWRAWREAQSARNKPRDPHSLI